ncbi:MAG: SGNH/GDSL hydrolase family protein [Cyclobacteriaceae bacterium]
MDTDGQTLSKKTSIRFLALGDSYTIGESVAELQRWPVQLMNALKARGYTSQTPKIIAVTGWRADDLQNALDNSSLSRDYNLVSLLIGVNNQYQGKAIAEYESQFEVILDRAILYAGGDKSKVFVLSIPDYGYTPFGLEKQSEISGQIDAFNAVNESIAEKKAVTYIDITDISRRGLKDPALVAEDGLHPSGKMYALWVERILENLLASKTLTH